MRILRWQDGDKLVVILCDGVLRRLCSFQFKKCKYGDEICQRQQADQDENDREMGRALFRLAAGAVIAGRFLRGFRRRFAVFRIHRRQIIHSCTPPLGSPAAIFSAAW